MATKQPPQQQPRRLPPGVTRGTVDKCPCPWCGKNNDLREVHNVMGMLEKDATLECDHCHNMWDIVGVQPITIVTVRQSPRNNELKARAQRSK